MEALGIVKKVGPGEPQLWSSAMHIAKKANGSIRPVGDYRPLNAVTTHDAYPLPCLKNIAPKLKVRELINEVK